jgi:hypothetical protein
MNRLLYPNEDFEEITRRILGTEGSPQTKNTESSRKERLVTFNMASAYSDKQRL